MTDERLAQRVTTFTQAVQRLHDAVNQPDTEFIHDAVMHRFEFCYELAWKMLTLQLARDGIEAQTPRHTIQMALQAGYIDDGNVWSEIQRMRNLTRHTYDAAMAAEVYSFVCTTVMPLFTQYGHATIHTIMSNGTIMALTTLQFGLSPRIIADLHAVFTQYPHIQQVRLFGSRATAHYHPAADIDLVVDAPQMPNSEWSALWNAIDELPLAFVIDLVHYDTIANVAFRAQIDATAVPFWSQKKGSASL